MQTLWLVVLLGLAVQAPAARVKRTQNSEVAKTHVAQEEEVQAEADPLYTKAAPSRHPVCSNLFGIRRNLCEAEFDKKEAEAKKKAEADAAWWSWLELSEAEADESEKEVELAEDAEEESAEDAQENQKIERMYAEAEAEEIERIYSEDPWSNQNWQDEGWQQVNDQLSDGYWYEHKDELKKDFIAPNSFESRNLQGVPKENVMQVFEVQENFRLINNQYVAKLEEEQDAYTRRPLRKKIRARLMKITDYFWTMHGHQAAQFFDQHGHLAGEYTMFHPVYFAKHWTWRVVKKADPDQIIYTIQKRFWNDHCKFAGFLACRPVLKIYKGEVGDKSTLIYYGVGDKKLKEPDFKFYHARSEYKQNRHQFWVGKIDHKKSKKFGRDKYKVYVKPGEDTGLLLLATACLDAVGDSVKR